MAGKIQLTPAELLAQSQEMLSLQQDFNDLFRQTDTILGQMNDNWSANLANNFAGKLSSAQKAFSQITSMLEQGGNLAANSANTFESMDSLLAKAMTGGGALESIGGTAAAVAGVSMSTTGTVDGALTAMGMSLAGTFDGLKEDWDTAGSTLEGIHQWLGSVLPEDLQDEAKKAAKKAFGSLYSAYSITYDLVTGNADKDTAFTAVSAIFGGTKGGAFKHAYEYAEEIGELDSRYQQKTIDLFLGGNIATGLINMGGSFVDEIGTGLIDVGGSMTIDAISKIPGVSFVEDTWDIDLSETWDHAMDSFHGAVTEGVQGFVDNVEKMEDKFQEAVADGLEAAGKALDQAVDQAAKAADEIGSAVGDGIKYVGDGIKNILPW